jgi:hypothetical protein
MIEIVDLSAIRTARDRPDPDLICRDSFGRELRTYVLEYEMGGKRWGFSIIASSMDEAETRVVAIRDSLILCGELHRVVPS